MGLLCCKTDDICIDCGDCTSEEFFWCPLCHAKTTEVYVGKAGLDVIGCPKCVRPASSDDGILGRC